MGRVGSITRNPLDTRPRNPSDCDATDTLVAHIQSLLGGRGRAPDSVHGFSVADCHEAPARDVLLGSRVALGLSDQMSGEPATKKDLEALEGTLEGNLEEVRGEMREMESRLREEIARHAQANAEHSLSQMKVLLEPLTEVPGRVDGLENEAETCPCYVARPP